ncbi:MAG: ABC transporter substrate-binding protein [Hyphomicrobiales bacterium]|nr:ABC transporter substrate-binding protein [Hyphomicrobiales bacterium]
MKLRFRLPGLLAIAATAVLAWGAPDARADKLAGRSVKIGCLASVTGKGAEWGQAGKLSMEIAAEEINAKGGIGGVPVELICYDTQTLEAEALKSASRLVERDKVLAISGPCFSGEFETVAPQLDRLKTVINSYCSAKPGLSDMSIWAFRNTLTSDKQLKPVVEAWLKDYKVKKVVIIYDAEDAVSKGEGAGVLPALFKANGVEVLDSLTYRTKDTDYSAQVTKAKALGAEGIGLGACYQNAGAIAKEMQKQGLNVSVVGGACAGAPGFIEIGGKAAEGAYMSTAAWLDDPRPEVQSYVKKILAKNNNQLPPYSGPRAYDIVYVYKHCIEKSGVTNKPADLDADRNRIRQCLAGLKGFPGVAGEITMDEHRDGAGSSAILKVINGKYVNVAK